MTLRKMILNINGVDRQIVCDPEDTLAAVIRRLGLTGTKVGCGAGQCGACSVLVDGKVVRSCTKKMNNVGEFSKITTIEGIGTPANLHPLQLAWIVYGGVQCGFCTPGFIVSAKGLLDCNSDPTREDVRAWFQKHRNACRCTGYKPIVDAVMAAAKVIRGEMTMEELRFMIPEDGRIYGTRYPRPAALAKVTGTCDYGTDVNEKIKPGAAYHMGLAQAKVSSAKVLDIDVTEAEKMPGVVKVVTCKDVKGSNRIYSLNSGPRFTGDPNDRPILVEDRVYQYGDVYAIVLADTRKNARMAAEKVQVTLEQTPAYMSGLEAVAKEAGQIFDGYDNIYAVQPVFKGGDTKRLFEEAAFVAEGSYYSQRQPHAVIEPDTLLAYRDEEGTPTVQCKSLVIHAAPFMVAGGTDTFPRVINNPVGASFGYSMACNTMAYGIVATEAVDGHPVCLDLDYTQHTFTTGKRAPGYTNIRMACDREGKIQAMDFELLFDHGAYGETATLLIEKGARFMGFPYMIPNIQGVSMVTCSNNSFTTAFRGYGSPQVYTASEQIVDELAEKAGIDPFEFRYRNVFRPGDSTNTGNTLEVYPMAELMDMMRPRYLEAMERARAGSTPDKKRGVGISCGGYNVTGNPDDYAEVHLELNPDGTVTNYNGWEDQGQGGDIGMLVLTHEALKPLGLSPDQIRLVVGDTAICPNTGPAAASRSHYMAGNAVIDAANQMMDEMRKPDGTFRTYGEMVAEGRPTRFEGSYSTAGQCTSLSPNTGQGNPTPAYTYAVYLAEVEVDVKTGRTKVLKMTVNADVGVIGSRQAVEGQAYGGVAQSIGLALSEDFNDPTKETNLIKLGLPFTEDIPDDIEINFLETPREKGPFGSSGCAELFLTSGHISVINAIYNATGVRIRELPALPSKVLEGIQNLENGVGKDPKKYFMGMDFEERIQYIKDNPVEEEYESNGINI